MRKARAVSYSRDGAAADPAKNKQAAPTSESTEAIAVYHESRQPVSLQDLMTAAGIELHEHSGPSAYVTAPIDDEELLRCIFVNAGDRRTRRRFSAAHELAHAAHFAVGARPELCRNGAEMTPGELESDPREKLCDRIAAEVLMPADLVLRSIFAAGGAVRPYSLAKQFDVSLTAMRARLSGLGLL